MNALRRTTFRWGAVLLLLAFGVWLAGRIAPGLIVRAPPIVILPDLAFERLDGSTVRLHGFMGRPLVINLWATWCGPCRRELPLMADMAAARPEVVFLFVDQREGRQQVEDYLREGGLELEWVLLDPRGRLADEFRSPGLPTTLFFDARGRLARAHVGELTAAALFNELTALTN